MEKFTVDLDAVLDEFEFHEGQANQSTVSVSPTVSGFFSPLTELGPSSLDQIILLGELEDVLEQHSTIIPSHGELLSPDALSLHKSFDTRYDLPFIPESPPPSYSSTAVSSAAEHTSSPAVSLAAEHTSSPAVSLAAEHTSSPAVSYIAPLVGPGTLASCPIEEMESPHANSEEMEEHHPHLNTVINTTLSGSSSPESTSEKSLAEELEELGDLVNFLPPPATIASALEAPRSSPAELTESAECSVESYPSHHTHTGLDIGSEDYVDERQLNEYLKQLEMEKCEEKLITENIPGSSCSSPGVDESLRTGTKPKQRSNPVLMDDLEPTIGLKQTCADIIISEDDLNPVIRSTRTESPPPYSEVDPNTDAERSRPERPHTLNLEATAAAAIKDEDSGETSDDTSVSGGDPVLGAPGETPSNPTGPRLGQSNILEGLSEDQLLLGRVQPFWVPDTDSLNCMICAVKFNVVKRRHHCRACGKVLCSGCCGEKFKLVYMENKEGRVCTPCKAVLERLEKVERSGSGASTSQHARPNPSNPMEYCSRIPVSEQVSSNINPSPSVMVPIGVLKRSVSTSEGNSLSRTENKSVIFSDGIRPGGDLAELDGGSEHRPMGKRPGKGKPRRLREKVPGVPGGDVCTSRLPATGLPFVSGKGKVEDEEIAIWFSAGTSVIFVLNNNLTVITRLVKYAPINKLVWNFASRGLTSVGQDEVVILLEAEEDEILPPRDVFFIIQTIYEQAGAGQPVLEMGHVTVNSEYLGSNSHGGWLFIRHTFQAVTDLFLPPPPVLFGILIMRWEIPWARIFPLRLMLRLGAEYRYYPAPLVSTRGRKSVYGEIGHTIMNVLADFKNYAYTLPTIRGLVIHMSPGKTLILIPKNRHEAVSKALNNSNDPVLALGANFSMSVDSHLVAIQNDDGGYQTQAINIQHKERVVTGASFVVFNGALKSTANLTAKSSIVEDGIMVQVLPDHMTALRKNLQQMEDVEIGCGPVGAPQPDEVVSIKWVDEDKAFNIGIKSVIDDKSMDGINSLRIHSGPDIRSDLHILRWTEVFLIKTPDPSSRGREPDPTRVAEGLARAVGVALLPHLADLKKDNLSPLAVRVSLDQDNVSYEAGSGGVPLTGTYMNNLDNELIPLIHSAAANSLVMELVFHVLDQ